MTQENTDTEEAAERHAVIESVRIGMFSESFHPIQNGVTTSIQTLVEGLRAQSHHVCVFAPANQHQRLTETNVMRFPSFVSVFNPDYPLTYPFLPRLTLEAHIDRLRLQLVHTHTPFILGLTGAKLALRREIPLVTTFHTLYTRYSHYVPLLPEGVSQVLIEHYLPWYYNRCAEIICPSSVAAKALLELGVTRPIEVIPTGIPIPEASRVNEKSRIAVREQMGLSLTAPMLLYAGRLAREKGLNWLLEVFVRVHHIIPEARLVLAGSGPLQEELQIKVASLKLQQAVLFLGVMPREAMDPLYAACDVFCFPSCSETQGLVIGEARAAGSPSVVADGGGAPETVQDGYDGFCIPPGDTPMFVDRIVELLQSPSLARQMRLNARRSAARFTPERMVQRILTVYHRARAQSPSGLDMEDQPFVTDRDLEAAGEKLYRDTLEENNAS